MVQVVFAICIVLWSCGFGLAKGKSIPNAVYYGINISASKYCKDAIYSKTSHCIEVNFSEKKLRYYRWTELTSHTGYWKPVVSYLVITPHPSKIGRCVVYGVVRKIDTRPTWTPSNRLRRLYDLPQGTIPYGHPYNAMGSMKFEINWATCKYDPLGRLHGTQTYAPSWETDESSGCIRLMNGRPGIDELFDLLGGKDSVGEGIQFILYR